MLLAFFFWLHINTYDIPALALGRVCKKVLILTTHSVVLALEINFFNLLYSCMHSLCHMNYDTCFKDVITKVTTSCVIL